MLLSYQDQDPTPYSSTEFRQLEQEWYQKLKQSGFEDIEETKTGQRYLKTWHSTYFQARYSPQIFQIKENYFRQASQFLHEHAFETPLEKEIWHLHSEGFSLRKISQELESLKLAHLNKDQVHRIVRKYVSLMFQEKPGDD